MTGHYIEIISPASMADRMMRSIKEIGIAAGIELIGAFEFNAAFAKQIGILLM